jgi:mono/diheme cytochrome c family protein
MLRYCKFALMLFVFLVSAAAIQAQTAVSNVCANSEDAKKLVNPVKPSAESLAQGKKYYGYDCAMCHGANGNGKGEVDTGEKLADFTNPDSLKDKTDGQIFCALKIGKGHMPLEPERNSPNNLWNLVNYVRSLSK